MWFCPSWPINLKLFASHIYYPTQIPVWESSKSISAERCGVDQGTHCSTHTTPEFYATGLKVVTVSELPKSRCLSATKKNTGTLESSMMSPTMQK